jgi:hypothetical protein
MKQNFIKLLWTSSFITRITIWFAVKFRIQFPEDKMVNFLQNLYVYGEDGSCLFSSTVDITDSCTVDNVEIN